MSRVHAISEATRRFLAEPRPFLVNGQWVRGDTDASTAAIDPATGAEIGRFHTGAVDDVARAVAAARASFDDARWRGLTPAARQRTLWRVAELIDANVTQLAELECLDGGKVFSSARDHEVPHAAETFRYYAGWCTKLDGHTFQPSVPGAEFHGYVRHEPVGVVAQIIPWNGALVAAAWKLAPALAAGCSVVLKPAEHSTLSVLWLGALLVEAGVPDGVVNIVAGSGRVLGAALAAHPDVDKIAFTGSTAVGKQLLSAAQGNLKRLTLELGGKSPTLIFADADLDAAIAGAAQAIFANAGQVCVAGSRVYAERAIYRQVTAGIARIAASLKLGPGLAPDTQMGPLISSAHRRAVHEIVSRSRGDDVRVLTGGEIAQALAAEGLASADVILADLGVSSMQLDNPDRGFSHKASGPLDMRMNPSRGATASDLIARLSEEKLAALLDENADEPYADIIAGLLKQQPLWTTDAVGGVVREGLAAALPGLTLADATLSVRRTFQALRIAVNDEFSVLNALLRSLPQCLTPGGRVAILSFHSGEDRRVKKAFQAGHREGVYSEVAEDVVRATGEECRANPRATPAKLRWAVRSPSL